MGIYLNPGNIGFCKSVHYDKTADTAIQQIKCRRYTQALEGYVGEILTVGINYDRNNADKPHSCVIERLKK